MVQGSVRSKSNNQLDLPELYLIMSKDDYNKVSWDYEIVK